MQLGLLAFTTKSIDEYELNLMKMFHTMILIAEKPKNAFIAIGKEMPFNGFCENESLWLMGPRISVKDVLRVPNISLLSGPFPNIHLPGYLQPISFFHKYYSII